MGAAEEFDMGAAVGAPGGAALNPDPSPTDV
jgi:hypothetical protein